MSVSSLSSSSNAYSYLQSLLQQQSAGSAKSADPISTLMKAFYPGGGASPSDSPTSGSSPGPASPASLPNPMPFSPDTLGAMISVQSQQCNSGGNAAAQSQSVFSEFDADGDGQISKSEFENAFGSNADKSKVDGLFNALDANGDDAVSQGELTSAAQQSRAHRHGHKHGGGEGGGLAALLSSTDVTGASSKTASNADGSMTTTINYADGTTVAMTRPAPAASSSSSNGSGAAGSTPSSNIIEQLIQLQSQLLTQAASSITTALPTI